MLSAHLGPGVPCVHSMHSETAPLSTFVAGLSCSRNAWTEEDSVVLGEHQQHFGPMSPIICHHRPCTLHPHLYIHPSCTTTFSICFCSPPGFISLVDDRAGRECLCRALLGLQGCPPGDTQHLDERLPQHAAACRFRCFHKSKRSRFLFCLNCGYTSSLGALQDFCQSHRSNSVESTSVLRDFSMVKFNFC